MLRQHGCTGPNSRVLHLTTPAEINATLLAAMLHGHVTCALLPGPLPTHWPSGLSRVCT